MVRPLVLLQAHYDPLRPVQIFCFFFSRVMSSMSSSNDLSAGDDEYVEKREVTTVLFVL